MDCSRDAPTGIAKVLRTTLKESRFFLAGSIGGIAGVVAGQPFDTIKVRLQTQCLARAKARGYTVWSTVQHMFWEEGIRGFYRGMSSPILGVSLQKSTAFGVYGAVKSHLQGDAPFAALYHVTLAGCIGGIANSAILTPVDQLKICLQVEHPPRLVASGDAPATLRDAARTIIEGRAVANPSSWSTSVSGIRALYSSLPATLLREVPGYSLYFTVYELLTRVRLQYDATWAIPIVGGIAGVTMWGLYYPLDMVKSRSMAQVAATALSPRGVAHTAPVGQLFRDIYREGGVQAFYRGVQPALVRAFFAHGAVFVMYESVLHATRTW